MHAFGYLGDAMTKMATAVCNMVVAVFALIPF